MRRSLGASTDGARIERGSLGSDRQESSEVDEEDAGSSEDDDEYYYDIDRGTIFCVQSAQSLKC